MLEDAFRAPKQKTGHDYRHDRSAKRSQGDPDVELCADNPKQGQGDGNPALAINSESQEAKRHAVEDAIGQKQTGGAGMLKDSHNGAKDAEAQVGQHGDPRMLDAFVGIIVDRERRGFRLVFHIARSYTIPSFIRPASLIMFWFHGGSQTS